MQEDRFISIKELTERGFGSRSKIDRLVKQGKITRIKIGSSTRFSAKEIENFIENCKQNIS